MFPYIKKLFEFYVKVDFYKINGSFSLKISKISLILKSYFARSFQSCPYRDLYIKILTIDCTYSLKRIPLLPLTNISSI